jgi:hypothetical protein
MMDGIEDRKRLPIDGKLRKRVLSNEAKNTPRPRRPSDMDHRLSGKILKAL